MSFPFTRSRSSSPDFEAVLLSLAHDPTSPPQPCVSRHLIQNLSLSRTQVLHGDRYFCIWTPHSHAFKSSLHSERYSRIWTQLRSSDSGHISIATRKCLTITISACTTFTTQVSRAVHGSDLLVRSLAPCKALSHLHSTSYHPFSVACSCDCFFFKVLRKGVSNAQSSMRMMEEHKFLTEEVHGACNTSTTLSKSD